MNKNEWSKTEKNLNDAGYSQSKSDPSKWSNGSNIIKVDSSNGFNDNGTKYRGYDTCNDHLDKKKK